MALVRAMGSKPSTLITKSITENGTYNAASDNADGYSQVSVNVPSRDALIMDRDPLSSDGVNGDTFIKYVHELIITLGISISGGYNGGARLICTVDGNTILNATGTSPYNLDYDHKIGNINYYGHVITVTVLPPATNTSDLVIIWNIDNIQVWSESIHYTGANTSYGYETQIINHPEYISSGNVISQIYYKQNNVWITVGDNINVN